MNGEHVLAPVCRTQMCHVTAAYGRLDGARDLEEQKKRYLEAIGLFKEWLDTSSKGTDIEAETIRLLGHRNLMESPDEPEIDALLLEIVQQTINSIGGVVYAHALLEQACDGRIPQESLLYIQLAQIRAAK